MRPAFALVTLGFLALGRLYSVPPVRLKDRPGFDVATNALGVGGFALLAGWTVARSLDGFPWIMVVATALYVPTTVTTLAGFGHVFPHRTFWTQTAFAPS